MRSVHIPLHSRKYPDLFAIVDEADAELVNRYRWRPRKAPHGQNVFYADTRIPVGGGKRKIVQMHRMLLGALPGEIVDHINRNTLDNQRTNIRKCSQQQNSCNRQKHVNNKSGFKGVFRHKEKWEAEICVSGKQVYLGSHRTREDAAYAYDLAAKHFHGEFAVTNVDLGLLPRDFVSSPPLPDTKRRRPKTQCREGKSSRFRGVSWNAKQGKWYASISVDSKRLFLGTHDDEITAALAYDHSAIDILEDRAILNFPGTYREWDDLP